MAIELERHGMIGSPSKEENKQYVIDFIPWMNINQNSIKNHTNYQNQE